MKPNESGMRRIISATRYSSQGVKFVWKNEAAFRQELIIAVCLIPLGMWLGENGVERALLTGVCFVVVIIELLNSGIEAAIDRIGPEANPLSGAAKDLGSAAVFFSLMLVLVVWALVLFG